MQKEVPPIPAEVAILLGLAFVLAFCAMWVLIFYIQKKKTGRWPKLNLGSGSVRRRSVPVRGVGMEYVDILQPVPIVEPPPMFLEQLVEQRGTEEVFQALGIPSSFLFPEIEEELGTPVEERSNNPIDAESAFEAVEQLVRGDVGLHPILDLDMLDRKHVILAGDTGNGKTQGQIAMMVRDIRRGAQVFWLNPDLALYNTEDQPTDLRPIEKHFVQVFDYAEILAHLETFVTIIQDRMANYRSNQPVGHFIIIYLDEWPGIVQVLGDPVTEAFKFIARQGRKVRVFLNMASQDALVDTIGVKSGVRHQFATRLVGRVDASSWTGLMGSGIPREDPERRGEWRWARPGGFQKVQIDPASKWEIAEIANRPAGVFPEFEIRSTQNNSIASSTLREFILVAGWLAEDETISNREIARRLWPESIPGSNGGGTWSVRAKVLRDQVLLLSVTGGTESGVPEPVTVTPTPNVTVTAEPVTAVTEEE